MIPQPPLPPLPPSPPLPTSPRANDATTDEEIYLMGATGLDEFLAFVRERGVDGRDMDRGELSASWRQAAEVYEELKKTEAGAADRPEIRALTPDLQAHIDRLVALPHFEASFGDVPVAFGMVALDTLVACQFHVGRHAMDALVARTPKPLSDSALAELCLPLTPPAASFKTALDDGERFVFMSDTHDARLLGARVIDPATISNFPVKGHAQAVIALTVGFTTNVLNVVRYGQRMVLNNGYHRALALLAMGVTHAPCLIQVCAHWEDVGQVGSSEMFQNGEVYFSSTRPPLLRDFANPKLTEKFASKRLTRQIQVSFEVDKRQLAL